MQRSRHALLIMFLIVTALTTPVVTAGAAGTENKAPILVGRISYVEGDLLRYVPDEDDWVLTVKDAPFGLNDALYSSDGAKAEFILPNQVWVRTGGLTQLQLIELREDVTEVDVASGVARFYNKSRDGVVKATTPFGYVVAEGDTIFDLYVGDESVEVVPVEGTVDFVHADGGSKYEVSEGAASLLADAKTVTSGEGNVDADWDDWSNDRDKFWARRLEVKGDSAEYVPDQLADSYADLDESGRWERVDYNGESQMMWRPTNVPDGWQPYTNGRWTEYYGDQCWVPDEPFGYVTHHYGNWVRNDSCGCWYWAPPVRRVAVAAAAPCECGWYPGRVGWFYSGQDVAWVPLTPSEPYYTHNYWGPGVVIGAGVGVGVGIGIGAYAWVNHAVIVPTVSLYSVRSYWGVRVTSYHHDTFIRTFHTTRVIDRTVIRDTRIYRDRYHYTDRRIDRFPHHDVTRRIQHNRDIARRDRDVSRRGIERDMHRANQGQFDRSRRVNNPRTSDRLVNRNDMNKPRPNQSGAQRDLKRNARNVRDNPDRRVGMDRSGRQGRDNRNIDRGTTGPRSPRDNMNRSGREGRSGRESMQGGRQGRDNRNIDRGTTGPRSPRDNMNRSGREGRSGRESMQGGRQGRDNRNIDRGTSGSRSPSDSMNRSGREGRSGRDSMQGGRQGKDNRSINRGTTGSRSPSDSMNRSGREGRSGRESMQGGRQGKSNRDSMQRPQQQQQRMQQQKPQRQQQQQRMQQQKPQRQQKSGGEGGGGKHDKKKDKPF